MKINCNRLKSDRNDLKKLWKYLFPKSLFSYANWGGWKTETFSKEE